MTNVLHKRKNKTVNLIHFLISSIDFFLSKAQKMKVYSRECFCNLEQVNGLKTSSFSKKTISIIKTSKLNLERSVSVKVATITRQLWIERDTTT